MHAPMSLSFNQSLHMKKENSNNTYSNLLRNTYGKKSIVNVVLLANGGVVCLY